MARRSNHGRNRDHNPDPLDDLDIQTPVARQRLSPAPLARAVRQKSVVEDRRNWAPRLQAARDTLGRPARIVHASVARKLPKAVRGIVNPRRSVLKALESSVPRFADARKAIICAKRKIRGEVLHALHRTKSGKGSRKRRNEWSDVQC
ncbi:hypothetical protein [Microvirus D_HF4_371]|nr:hypothetical protein [Microvirus D_HF4_371]